MIVISFTDDIGFNYARSYYWVAIKGQSVVRYGFGLEQASIQIGKCSVCGDVSVH